MAGSRLRDRSTGDLLVIMIAGTVCAVVVGTSVTLIVSEVLNPDADTSGAAGQIGDIINTLIGLLAGFLAGRTDYNIRSKKTDGDHPDEL